MPTRRRFLELGALFLAAPAPARGAAAVGRRLRPLALAVEIPGAPEALADGIDFGIAEARRVARPTFLVEAVAAGMEATATFTREGFRVGNRSEVWRIVPSAVSLAPAFVASLKEAGFRQVWWMPPGGLAEAAARQAASAVGLATAATVEDADLVFWSTEPVGTVARPAEPPSLPPTARPGAALAVSWVPAEANLRPGTFHPALWHSTLTGPGAAQLGARFRARAQGPLDSFAWAGWLSVKAVLSAVLQAGSAEPARVRDALSDLRLDGHKGAPLHFAERQLVQPVYVVGPVEPGAMQTAVRGQLDLSPRDRPGT